MKIWQNAPSMMMGLAKMRARRTPANQAHVTNRKEHQAPLTAALVREAPEVYLQRGIFQKGD